MAPACHPGRLQDGGRAARRLPSIERIFPFRLGRAPVGATITAMTQPDEPSHLLVPPVPPLEVGPRSDGRSALWIEPDAAQGVIDELYRIANEVHEQAGRCARAYVAPHAGDEVSRNAAAQANLMADRARDFCLAWSDQLGDAADRLTEQLRAYRAVEDENRRRLA
jgi:hypothetical protein